MNFFKDLLGISQSDYEDGLKKKTPLINFKSAIISSTALEEALRKSFG